MKNPTFFAKLALPLISIIFTGFLITISSFYKETWFFDWKDTRPEVIDTILVAQYDFHQWGFEELNYASEGSDRFKWLVKNATIPELKLMTEYPVSNLKLAGYEGLLKNKAFLEKKKLIFEILQDTSSVAYLRGGCIISSIKISDYIVNDVLYLDENLPLPPELPNGMSYMEYNLNKFGLTPEDGEEILKLYKNGSN